MGLSISILFLPILNYLSASKIVSISYILSGFFGLLITLQNEVYNIMERGQLHCKTRPITLQNEAFL